MKKLRNMKGHLFFSCWALQIKKRFHFCFPFIIYFLNYNDIADLLLPKWKTKIKKWEKKEGVWCIDLLQ